MAAVVGGAAAGAVGQTALAEAFGANVVAQDSSLDAPRWHADDVERTHVRAVAATMSGWVEYDLGAVRSAAMTAQSTGSLAWPDDARVVLVVPPGAPVEAGETLMTARCPKAVWPALRRALAAAVRIGHRPEAPRGAIQEVVGV